MSDEFYVKGRLVQHLESITLVNNTQLTTDITVPAGRRWLVFNIKVANQDNVNRDIYVTKWVEAAKTNCVKRYAYGLTVGSGLEFNFPDTATSNYGRNALPDIWIAGNTLEVVHAAGGASAGATDADGIVIEYLELID